MVESPNNLTSADQVARDIKMGKFPAMSETTKAELAERERVFDIVKTELKRGYASTNPSVAVQAIWDRIARNVAIEVVPTAAPLPPEHNGGDIII